MQFWRKRARRRLANFILSKSLVLSEQLLKIQFLQGFDPAVMPLGIITLEDVLEGMKLFSE
jgi:hypothetical protein